jgi:hypothetical protein
MRLNIHHVGTRFLFSAFVFLVVLLLIGSHLDDVEPPRIVEILMLPVAPLGWLVSRILPHGNIGTSEHPIIEGTPLDLVAGLALVFSDILLYPVAAYFLLWLLSKILSSRAGYPK